MNILTVHNLTKTFAGLTAVDEVSFSIKEGQIVGLIGPNGAGKTTTFSMISGFVRPTYGSIKFMDEELVGKSADIVARKGIVTTFQKTKIFQQLSIEQAVMIGTHVHNKAGFADVLLHNKKYYAEEEKAAQRVKEVLDFLGLTDKKDMLCTNLSYGEQRILEIAVALAASPKLLLLDEPAAGLNDSESIQLMNIIRNIREQGITILLVEHDMHLVMNICEEIVVLNFGRMLVKGTPEQVTSNKEVVEAYLGQEGDD